MIVSEERLIRDLTEKSHIDEDDYVVIEDLDGSKIAPVKTIKKLILKNLIFKNVEDMKNATDLKEGDHCLTLGYHSPGDGGASLYRIVYEPVAVEDGANWLYLHNSDVNRAKFVPMGGCITPEQFGAYGDGVHDDYNAITKCIDSPYRIRFTQQNIYKITRAIQLNTKELIDLDGCIIRPYMCSAFEVALNNKGDAFEDIVIKNGTIDMNYSSTSAIGLYKHINNITIRDIRIMNADYNSTLIKINKSSNAIIEDCQLQSRYDIATSSVGIYIAGPDGDNDPVFNQTKVSINNVNFIDCFDAIVVASSINNSSAKSSHIDITNCSAKSRNYGNFLKNLGNTATVGYGKKFLKLKNINTSCFNTVINNIGNDFISISDMYDYGSNEFINSAALESSLSIEGLIVFYGASNSTLFKALHGKLYKNTGAIETSASIMGSDCSCKLYDTSDVYSNKLGDISGGTVNVNAVSNGYYDVTTSGTINITGGMVNQIIALRAINCTFNIANSVNVDIGRTNALSVSNNGDNEVVYFKKMSNLKWTRL